MLRHAKKNVVSNLRISYHKNSWKWIVRTNHNV